MSLPKTKLTNMDTNDKIDRILQIAIVGENFVSYNKYGQETADKCKKMLLSLIHQAEIKARIDELKRSEYWGIGTAAIQLGMPVPVIWETAVLKGLVNPRISERISALEKEINNGNN